MFVEEVTGRFGELRLKERITWIAEVLERHLPNQYRDAVEVLLRSLPDPADPTLSDGDFGDFTYAPYGEFIARGGTALEDVEFSLSALKEITTRFSAEFAIRSYLLAHPEATMKALLEWASDPHYHVRRLASEGTRPRLPWASRLPMPVSAGIPILDRLFADPTRYVTRSVANHLNDIAKSDPDMVVSTLQRWQASGQQRASEMTYITRQAARTLIKTGHGPALELIGIPTGPQVAVTGITVPPIVELGGSAEISVSVCASERVDCIISYAIVFAGPRGLPSGRKVYTLKRLTIPAGASVTLTKRHTFRAGMTTRPIHPGQHRIEILTNGVPQESRTFEITSPPAGRIK
jgi:3-methyladenine DNA glycosylase AlkC